MNGKQERLQGSKNSAWTKAKGKLMLEKFFNYEGVIHYEFIPNGKTVNKENLCTNSS